ncbi:MAG: hypothetical protein BWX92_01500 [Deltaproteobacteria bacterium ADurb.Bin135]|jgi:hypothetical protein|nr:MAG: hypothetical protein BWX92_01500 [Deltaproteobacteria bacterium ADurb.Bin135]
MELCNKKEQETKQMEEIEMTEEEMKQAMLDLYTRKRFGLSEQVKKKTGEFYHFNIDPVSFNSLKKASENLRALGLKMSHSVIVRDALRMYCDLTNNISIDDEGEVAKRAYALIKAMRGTE